MVDSAVLIRVALVSVGQCAVWRLAIVSRVFGNVAQSNCFHKQIDPPLDISFFQPLLRLSTMVVDHHSLGMGALSLFLF